MLFLDAPETPYIIRTPTRYSNFTKMGRGMPTFKQYAFFQHAAALFPRIPFVGKIDDDTAPNLRLLVPLLQSVSSIPDPNPNMKLTRTPTLNLTLALALTLVPLLQSASSGCLPHPLLAYSTLHIPGPYPDPITRTDTLTRTLIQTPTPTLDLILCLIQLKFNSTPIPILIGSHSSQP